MASGASLDAPAPPIPQEVEIKLRLPTAADHAAALRHLARLPRPPGAPAPVVLTQVNAFFDGPGGELSARRSVLRVRSASRAHWTEGDDDAGSASGEKVDVAGARADVSWTLTYKGQQVISADGVGRAAELEGPLSDATARAALSDGDSAGEVSAGPSSLLALADAPPGDDVDPGARAAASAAAACFPTGGPTPSLIALGGFRNRRVCLPWAWTPPGSSNPVSLVLEVDRTSYSHGVVHEVECELPAALQGDQGPEGTAAALVRDLTAALAAGGAECRPAGRSKFANFLNKTLE